MFVVRRIVIAETCFFTLHKLIAILPLYGALPLNHNPFGKFQARTIGKINYAFNCPACSNTLFNFDFSLCRRAVFDSFFDEFKYWPTLRITLLGFSC